MPTTATQWLNENPGSWLELQDLMERSGLPIGLLTEFPDWMKDEIASHLADTFYQDYWDDIQSAFTSDVNKYLEKGIIEGKSIRQMAYEMATNFQGGITDYALVRARNIARTESGHALNGARKSSIEHVLDSTDLRAVIKTVWLSVLGSTTRDTHANLDGVPADKDGMWELSGYRIPWPGHISLPPSERCNCQCTIVTEFGMQDDAANALIDDYNRRVEEYNQSLLKFRDELETKFNPYHGPDGRFTTGPGGGAMMAPDTGVGMGGGGSGDMANAKYDEESKKWKLSDGNPIPEHIPRIPPAWSNVQVSTNPKSDVIVTGKDAKGRPQSLYSEAHWVAAAEKKFARVNELRGKQKEIRKEIESDIKGKNREQAACLRLIQTTGMRPGSAADTGAKKQAYGASTLKGSHVHVNESGEVRLKFTGKKGVERDVLVTDNRTAKDLIRRKKKAGDDGQLFDTTSGQLLTYAKSKDGGGFKTKDFRTAKGTTSAIAAMKGVKKPKTEKEYKKAVKAVATKVAEELGNTPTVALQSYINPNVFAWWRKGIKFGEGKKKSLDLKYNPYHGPDGRFTSGPGGGVHLAPDTGGGTGGSGGVSSAGKDWQDGDAPSKRLEGKEAWEWFKKQDPERVARIEEIASIGKRMESTDWGRNVETGHLMGMPRDALAPVWANMLGDKIGELYFEKDGFSPKDLARQIDNDCRRFESGYGAGWLSDKYKPLDPGSAEKALKGAIRRRVSGEDYGMIITKQARRISDGKQLENAWKEEDGWLNQRSGVISYHPLKDVGNANTLLRATKRGEDSYEKPLYRGDWVPRDIKIGDTIDIALGSFSKSKDVAHKFAMRASKKVVLVLPKGAEGLDIDGRGMGIMEEKEFLVSGKWKVQKVSFENDVTMVILGSSKKAGGRTIRLDSVDMDITKEYPFALALAMKKEGQKYNPYHGPDGRFTSGPGGGVHLAPDTGGGTGGGRGRGRASKINVEKYKEVAKVYKESKGLDLENNKKLIEIANVKVVCPDHLREVTERAVAHIIGDGRYLANQIYGASVNVKNLGKLYGKSKGTKLYVNQSTLEEEGAGFGATIIRHEIEHTILTNQGIPSGKQEHKALHAGGMFAARKYGSMAITNPKDALGFKKAAQVSGIKVKSVVKYLCLFADLPTNAVELPGDWEPLYIDEEKSEGNLQTKDNPYHGPDGRFTSGPSDGSPGGSGGGECYKESAKALMDNVPVIRDWKNKRLVQGYPTLTGGEHVGEKFGHAWVEGTLDVGQGMSLPMVYDASSKQSLPKSLYYKIGNIDPKESKSYTVTEARKQAVRTGHWGPWTDGPAGARFAERNFFFELKFVPRNMIWQ